MPPSLRVEHMYCAASRHLLHVRSRPSCGYGPSNTHVVDHIAHMQAFQALELARPLIGREAHVITC